MERHVLQARNVMPARRNSVSLARPVLPEIPRIQLRRNSLGAPPRGEMLFDGDFA